MKKLMIFGALLALPFLMFGQALETSKDTTLVLHVGGFLDSISITVPVEYVDSALNQIVSSVGGLLQDGTTIINAIKKEDPKGAIDWIMLLLTTLLPVVTSFITRFTRTIKSISGYFKGDSTLSIVVAVSAILAAVYELIKVGWSPDFFNNWSSLFVFAFAGSMFFYERVLKKWLGKTPKKDPVAV
jgi:hypothetical protein